MRGVLGAKAKERLGGVGESWDGGSWEGHGGVIFPGGVLDLWTGGCLKPARARAGWRRHRRRRASVAILAQGLGSRFLRQLEVQDRCHLDRILARVRLWHSMHDCRST